VQTAVSDAPLPCQEEHQADARAEKGRHTAAEERQGLPRDQELELVQILGEYRPAAAELKEGG